jgi:ribose transport system permease protein
MTGSDNGPAALTAQKTRRARPSIRDWLARNATLVAPAVALVLLCAVFEILAPETFLTPGNIRNILSQTSVLAFLATGVTFILLVGEIDLSVANVAVVSGVMAALLFSGIPITIPILGQLSFGAGSEPVAVATALVLGMVLGTLAGTLVSRLGVPSFIATLGVMMLADGLSYYWSQGRIIYDLMPAARALGGTYWGPLPAIVLSAATVIVVAHLVLSRTRFGRYVYMTGANRAAAELAGVSTRRVLLQVFIVSAFLAAIGGIVNTGRLGSAEARTGSELLLPAIAAVVLGGTSVFGGVGGMANTTLGLLVYGVLNNGLDQVQMDIYLKPFARGAFLLLAIVFNITALRIASRSRARVVKQAEDVVIQPPEASTPAEGEQPK